MSTPTGVVETGPEPRPGDRSAHPYREPRADLHAHPHQDAARDVARDRRRRRWGRIADLVIAVALVVLVGVWALRFLDSTAYVVVVLQTAGPLVTVGLLLLTAATLLLRRWWTLVPVGTALVVAVVAAVPAWTARTTPKADVDFTVLSANLYQGRANARQLMDAVKYHSVDVLVLTEVTPTALEAFERNGAGEFFSARAGSAQDGVAGTMILSRYPLSVRDAGAPTDGAISLQPDVDVTTPVGTVRLRAVHPPAPLRGRTDAWHAALSRLDGWVGAQPTGEPLVLAGDFNAATGHPVYRRLAAGLDDAQAAAGLGWVRTWPFTGRRMPPYVEIDHLLTRGLTVVEAGQVVVNGADHAAVWASYAMPGDAGRR